MQISTRVESLPASGIRKIFDQVVVLERKGEKVIRFDVGRPDFETPRFVVEAAKSALDNGFTKYVANRGIPDLCDAISRKLETQNGVRYDPGAEIIVTVGASEAVAITMLGILEPGSEALIPTPAWPHYECCARLAGATPVSVPLDLSDGFALTSDLLERRVTEKTRLLVVGSPGNPSGRVYSKAELEDILSFAIRHDLYVLADEIYECFIYDDPPPCFASLPGARERTILVNGFSKTFGMTGWRIGYLAAPAELAAQLNKPHQYMTVCATSFAQMGAVAAYTHPESAAFVSGITRDFKNRRAALLESVKGVDSMRYCHPGGAFYFFPALPGSAPASEQVALTLLEKAKVAVIPGAVFGEDFDNHIRISYGSCSVEDLREGVRRILDLFYR